MTDTPRAVRVELGADAAVVSGPNLAEQRAAALGNDQLSLVLDAVAGDVVTALTHNPRAVIAGHKRPGSDDSPKIIEETRQYIRDFDRVAETTTTARELYDKMLELYPDRGNPGLALWISARAAKP